MASAYRALREMAEDYRRLREAASGVLSIVDDDAREAGEGGKVEIYSPLWDSAIEDLRAVLEGRR